MAHLRLWEVFKDKFEALKSIERHIWITGRHQDAYLSLWEVLQGTFEALKAIGRHIWNTRRHQKECLRLWKRTKFSEFYYMLPWGHLISVQNR